jgi:hypothetical protein
MTFGAADSGSHCILAHHEQPGVEFDGVGVHGVATRLPSVCAAIGFACSLLPDFSVF